MISVLISSGKTGFFSKKWSILACFWVFLAIFSASKIHAQEVVSLRGRITNDSLEDSYLHVMNLNLQRGTITNVDGTFIIPVRLNDTLYISAVQFEDQKILVTRQLLEQKTVNITLKTAINELKTVNISDVQLSGRLGQDVKNTDIESYFDQTDVGFAPTAKKRSPELRALQFSGGFGIGALINVISGRRKMLKRNLRISAMERRVKLAQNLFGTAFYVDELDIPADLIDDFCYFVYEDNERALQLSAAENPLPLIRFLRERAKSYRRHKNIQD